MLLVKRILLRLFHPLFFAESYYRNSQCVHRDFTIAVDQSESRTQQCHVRITYKAHLQSYKDKVMKQNLKRVDKTSQNGINGPFPRDSVEVDVPFRFIWNLT